MGGERLGSAQHHSLDGGPIGTASFSSRAASYLTMTHLTRRAFIVAVAALTAGAAGCSDPVGVEGGVQIRLVNNSPFAFDEVEVNFSAQNESYGSLAVGAATGYRSVRLAYRYAYVRVRSGNKTVVQQPIDYVGETALAPGRYSYVIELTTLDEPFAAITRLQPE